VIVGQWWPVGDNHFKFYKSVGRISLLTNSDITHGIVVLYVVLGFEYGELGNWIWEFRSNSEDVEVVVIGRITG